VDIAYSVNRVPIRLTDERWQHIVRNKPYMQSYYDEVLGTIENPTWILRGYGGALVAVQPFKRPRFLHVVYREVSSNDGFIITAFLTRKVNRSAIIWQKRN
jgi:hypothetical protein